MHSRLCAPRTLSPAQRSSARRASSRRYSRSTAAAKDAQVSNLLARPKRFVIWCWVSCASLCARCAVGGGHAAACKCDACPPRAPASLASLRSSAARRDTHISLPLCRHEEPRYQLEAVRSLRRRRAGVPAGLCHCGSWGLREVRGVQGGAMVGSRRVVMLIQIGQIALGGWSLVARLTRSSIRPLAARRTGATRFFLSRRDFIRRLGDGVPAETDADADTPVGVARLVSVACIYVLCATDYLRSMHALYNMVSRRLQDSPTVTPTTILAEVT